jgi:hypothetical protein
VDDVGYQHDAFRSHGIDAVLALRAACPGNYRQVAERIHRESSKVPVPMIRSYVWGDLRTLRSGLSHPAMHMVVFSLTAMTKQFGCEETSPRGIRVMQPQGA